MKKHLLLLITAMLFSTVSTFAQDCDYSGAFGPLEWCLKDGTLTISGEGEMPNYYLTTIPWFEYRESINTVIIENGVTSIGSDAFYNTSLTTITLPNSLISIGDAAFYSCKNLITITLPSNLANIASNAFGNCTNFTSINVESGNNTYASENGVLFNKGKTTLICYPSGKTGEYVIPNGVTTIGERAFDGPVNLSSINIPNSLITIEKSAFIACTFTSITIPSSVTSVGLSAFFSCKNLTSINIESGNSIYASENGVLFDKSKTTLICCPEGKVGTYTVPNGVTNIEMGAFAYCEGLTSIFISNSVTDIGLSAFWGCSSLESISIGNNVTTIGENAFAYCTSLMSIDVDDENNSYASENGVFFNKSKTILFLYPAKKTGEYYVIPNGVRDIERVAFYACKNLTSITIPNSVENFGINAFLYCENLTLITNLNPEPVVVAGNIFTGVNVYACTLKVPIESVVAYQNTDVWKNFNVVGFNVGIENIESTTVKVYPNPTTGELRIESGELRIENVVIYDVFGKIQKIEEWKVENTIDISHLSAGVYFVKINTGTGEVVKKVLKE